LGTPPKEGKLGDFPSFGGVSERRGGFSIFGRNDFYRNDKTMGIPKRLKYFKNKTATPNEI